MSRYWTQDEDAAFRAGVNDDTNSNGSTPDASTWAPVDLAAVVAGIQAGEIVGPVPRVMRRTDGVCLLYPGEIHSLAGEPESCKGWIVLATVAGLIAAGETVLYLDFEDAVASIVTRLIALGAPPNTIPEWLTYVRPTDPFNAAAFGELIDARSYTFAVIDGLSEAYALLGFEISSNDDAARFLTAIPRPLADRGAAVLAVDHVGRDKDQRGRYAIGAQHKLAGVAAAYGTEVVDAPSRTSPGLVKLKVFKDRHGHVRGHAVGKLIAQAAIVPRDDGAHVTVTLSPPAGGEGDGDQFRPTRLMEKTSRAVEQQPGISNTELRTGVTGKGEYKATALRLLIAGEYVRQEQDGKTTRHYSLRPYREGDECTL